LGCVSAIDSNARTIFVADAHRDDGKRFVVRADEKLTAFVELEESRANHRASQSKGSARGARNAGMIVVAISCDASLNNDASPIPRTVRLIQRIFRCGIGTTLADAVSRAVFMPVPTTRDGVS
jgi:hypothetical protein